MRVDTVQRLVKFSPKSVFTKEELLILLDSITELRKDLSYVHKRINYRVLYGHSFHKEILKLK